MTWMEFIKFFVSLFIVIGAIIASLSTVYKILKVEPKKEIDKEIKKSGIFFASLIVGGICLFISLFLKSVAFFASGEPPMGAIFLILSFFIDIVVIIMVVIIFKNRAKKKRGHR